MQVNLVQVEYTWSLIKLNFLWLNIKIDFIVAASATSFDELILSIYFYGLDIGMATIKKMDKLNDLLQFSSFNGLLSPGTTA